MAIDPKNLTAEQWRALAEERGVPYYFDLPEYKAMADACFEQQWAHAFAEVRERANYSLLFEFVADCFQLGRPVPAWAADAFFDRVLHWKDFGCATIDEAFGLERTKGLNLAKERERLLLGWEVSDQIQYSRAHKGLSYEAAIELAAEVHEISTDKARRLYQYHRDLDPERYPTIRPKPKS